LPLRWGKVDLDRGGIRIVESLEQTKTGLRFKAPKTDRARAVTLPDFAVEDLRRLKREEAESLLTLACGRLVTPSFAPAQMASRCSLGV
jgi:integrase